MRYIKKMGVLPLFNHESLVRQHRTDVRQHQAANKQQNEKERMKA